MAVTADRVIVELEAKLDRYEANVRRAEQKFDAATRAIANDAKRMERDIAASTGAIGAQFRQLAATAAGAFSAAQVAAMADSYTRFTNQLRVAGLEGQALADTQNRLFGVAQQNGVQLEAVGTLYSRAAQNQKELGASTADLINLTRAVAASLKISGTSAAEAQGSLLQLGQALGSPRIQAEEFNSLLDTMQPLLREAAKYIDGTGGSLAGLTQRIKDTNGPGVSNVELFRAITQAMADLETRASSTQLTISGAFTNLSNALTKYIGEADQANGASVAITGALNSLAQNLDTVTEALSVLAAVMLGRFVAGMVAGAASTGVVGTAIFAMQARAVGAATTMEALALTSRTAGAAMLAAFGGPVGLAVTALAVGIGYLAAADAEAAQESQSLTASIDQQAAAFANVAQRQAETNAAADNLSATQRAALTSTANLTGEANLLAEAWGRVAAQAKAAALEQARAAATTARTNRIAAEAAVRTRNETERNRPSNAPAGSFRGVVGHFTRGIADTVFPDSRARTQAEAAAERQRLETARENERLANQNLAEVRGQRLETFRPPAPTPAPASGGGGRTRTRTGTGGRERTGPDPDEIARRFENDVARAELEIRAAQADAIGTATARRDFEREQIRAQQEQNAREIRANDDYSAAQKERLLSLNDQIAANRLAAIAAAEQAEAAQAAVDIRQAELADQQEMLRLQAGLADTAKERRDIELRILELQYEEERLRLEAIAASAQSTEAEKEIARRRLAQLDEQYDTRRQGVERQNESPLEKYRREMNKSAGQIQEQAEQWVVDELEGIQDALSGAIQKKLGVKDPILGGIIDLFIEQVIMKPLTDAFAQMSQGGGGGLGGLISSIGSAIGSLFGGGRASGGHVVGGQMYRVNETGIEGFKPAGSGQIIPLGRMRSAGGGGVQIHQSIKIDASNSVTPDGFADYIVARTRQETSYIVSQASRQQMKNVPGRMAQYQRDGT